MRHALDVAAWTRQTSDINWHRLICLPEDVCRDGIDILQMLHNGLSRFVGIYMRKSQRVSDYTKCLVLIIFYLICDESATNICSLVAREL